MKDKNDDLHHIAANLRQPVWDNRPASLADEIRNFLKSIKDEGTSIDSGSGDGIADLWVVVDGVEYYVYIRKSNNQLKKEGKEIPSVF